MEHPAILKTRFIQSDPPHQRVLCSCLTLSDRAKVCGPTLYQRKFRAAKIKTTPSVQDRGCRLICEPSRRLRQFGCTTPQIGIVIPKGAHAIRPSECAVRETAVKRVDDPNFRPLMNYTWLGRGLGSIAVKLRKSKVIFRKFS